MLYSLTQLIWALLNDWLPEQLAVSSALAVVTTLWCTLRKAAIFDVILGFLLLIATDTQSTMSEDFCKSSQLGQSAIACDAGVSEVHAGVDGIVHGVGEDGGDGDRGAGLDVARMGH